MKLVFTSTSAIVFFLTFVFDIFIQASFAQTPKTTVVAPPKPTSLVVEGETLDKKAFQLSGMKDKVALVMFWSTNCPVCRDQMPELRENIQGWANKPFELILVNTDKNLKDVADYYAVLKQVVPFKQRFTQLWVGDANYKDSINAKQIPIKQLPVTFLIDKSGKVVEVYYGRIPAQSWDDISELL